MALKFREEFESHITVNKIPYPDTQSSLACTEKNWKTREKALTFAKQALFIFVKSEMTELQKTMRQNAHRLNHLVSDLHRSHSLVIVEQCFEYSLLSLIKAFLPSEENKDVNSIQELGVNDLIRVILNCTHFDKVVDADLSESSNVFKRVLMARKLYMHPPKCDISDEELDICLNDITEMLTDAKTLKDMKESKSAVRQIQQLKRDRQSRQNEGLSNQEDRVIDLSDSARLTPHYCEMAKLHELKEREEQDGSQNGQCCQTNTPDLPNPSGIGLDLPPKCDVKRNLKETNIQETNPVSDWESELKEYSKTSDTIEDDDPDVDMLEMDQKVVDLDSEVISDELEICKEKVIQDNSYPISDSKEICQVEDILEKSFLCCSYGSDQCSTNLKDKGRIMCKINSKLDRDTKQESSTLAEPTTDVATSNGQGWKFDGFIICLIAVVVFCIVMCFNLGHWSRKRGTRKLLILMTFLSLSNGTIYEKNVECVKCMQHGTAQYRHNDENRPPDDQEEMTIHIEKKEDEPCKKEDEPCKKEDEPCKKEDEPCKKEDEPSKKEDEPCKKEDEPCKKEDEPCKKEDEPSKKEDEPCKKEDEPSKKEDEPCKKEDEPCKKEDKPCKKEDEPCKDCIKWKFNSKKIDMKIRKIRRIELLSSHGKETIFEESTSFADKIWQKMKMSIDCFNRILVPGILGYELPNVIHSRGYVSRKSFASLQVSHMAYSWSWCLYEYDVMEHRWEHCKDCSFRQVEDEKKSVCEPCGSCLDDCMDSNDCTEKCSVYPENSLKRTSEVALTKSSTTQYQKILVFLIVFWSEIVSLLFIVIFLVSLPIWKKRKRGKKMIFPFEKENDFQCESSDRQSKMTDCQDKSTASRDKSTTCQDESTACQDESTASRDKSTTCQDESTACQDESTASRDKSTTCQDESTACQDESTTFQDESTVNQSESTDLKGESIVCSSENTDCSRDNLDQTASKFGGEEEDIVDIDSEHQDNLSYVTSESDYQRRKQELKNELIKFYKRRHRKISLSPLLEEIDTPLSSFCVMPDMQKSPTGHHQIGSFPVESSSDLPTSPSEEETKINLSTDVGFRKTSFSRYLWLTWAQTSCQDRNQDQYEIIETHPSNECNDQKIPYRYGPSFKLVTLSAMPLIKDGVCSDLNREEKLVTLRQLSVKNETRKLSRMLREDNNLNLNKVTTSEGLEKMQTTPILPMFMTSLWDYKISIVDSRHEVSSNCEYFLKSRMAKKQVKVHPFTEPSVCDILLYYSKETFRQKLDYPSMTQRELANHTFFNDKNKTMLINGVFAEKYLKTDDMKYLFSGISTRRTSTMLKEQRSIVSFSHKTVQEFLATIFIMAPFEDVRKNCVSCDDHSSSWRSDNTLLSIDSCPHDCQSCTGLPEGEGQIFCLQEKHKAVQEEPKTDFKIVFPNKNEEDTTFKEVEILTGASNIVDVHELLGAKHHTLTKNEEIIFEKLLEEVADDRLELEEELIGIKVKNGDDFEGYGSLSTSSDALDSGGIRQRSSDAECKPRKTYYVAEVEKKNGTDEVNIVIPSENNCGGSQLDVCSNETKKLRLEVVPNSCRKFQEQSDVMSVPDAFVSRKRQFFAKSTRIMNQGNGRFLNLKNIKVKAEKSANKKIDCTLREEEFERMMLLRETTWLSMDHLPVPKIDITIAHITQFEPIMNIIDLIAAGTPPTPHVSMRYELLRFCTLRSYPKEDKPYLIKLAEAGFYYASDGDGVVCYCCGVRRYNWTAEDNPRKVHERINPSCKFLRKNDEVNVPVQFFGPYSKELMAIMDIPECIERPEVSEDVNNDWAPERVRAPAAQQQNNKTSQPGASTLGINTAIPKHSQYATKTAREASFSSWPDTSSHTPEILADAGFFYAGFGDCVRCFYCGIGLRHWTSEDDPWIEHARWSRNCVFVKNKKGEEFVNLVQLAVQYSQDNENNTSGQDQHHVHEIERILLSDAAQSVLEMGYQPRIIKQAIESIITQNARANITSQILMEKVLEIEESSNQSAAGPQPTATTTTTPAPAAAAKSETAKPEVTKPEPGKTESAPKSKAEKKSDKPEKSKDNKGKVDPDQDPKAIKRENEELKEQTLCKVCLDNTVCIVFLPCGHLVTCADCAPAMRKCPICRALVKGTVRTYMS